MLYVFALLADSVCFTRLSTSRGTESRGIDYHLIFIHCSDFTPSIIVNDEAIPDISDREFNTIQSRIAETKGHRITVILDCSYGGFAGLPDPATRTSHQTTHATLQDMLLTEEKNMKDRPGYRSILSKSWYSNMISHVILTASEDYQFASEEKLEGKDGRHIGVFTDSLVRVLWSGYIIEHHVR